MTELCRRYWISGRVQGVYFRASTRDQAVRLGLRGYARNLADGRVEVLACGDAQALQCLHDWLQHGPPQAAVLAVSSEALAEPWHDDGFRTC